MAEITLTPRAAKRINEIMGAEPPGALAARQRQRRRLLGLLLRLRHHPRPEAQDVTIERDGATVVVDPVSLEYMAGSTIDFVNDLIGQSFKIENPQATASCGCGTSFSL